ncbi:MAG: DUF4153 domain-containing protein [Vicinamibacterales bacterium]
MLPGPLALPVLAAGLALGALGDALLYEAGAPGLNFSLWVAAIALAAVVVGRRAGLAPDPGRMAWLALAVLFAAGPAWRDAPPLRLLSLGCVSLAFGLAAYRLHAAWVRRAGVSQYAVAWGTGALHAWTASALVLAAAARATRAEPGPRGGWTRAGAVARGLAIAAPLLVIFGALFMSADAVFADLVLGAVRLDIGRFAEHLLLFTLAAWLTTGYLRGFLAGTELPALESLWRDRGAAAGPAGRPVLGLTEVATALAALNLLFLAFVIVQFRYLFGGDALVQVTPDLTYAEYARRGFFELVVAALLVGPVLLAADWLLERRAGRDDRVFRGLAGVQIGLVLAIAASALERLRLYHASYGLTESRFYATALLAWIAAMLLWFAWTVLRGRRDAFGFGALVAGLGTIVVLAAVNPAAIVAATNVARLDAPDGPARFDVAYAASMSADAWPVLLDALPRLPGDAQCRLARRVLRRWGPEAEASVRNWNWSVSRARAEVRRREMALRGMAGQGGDCGLR